MSSINISAMSPILPPALANAALLIAAPSLGCIDTYVKTLTSLCSAYHFPIPDFTHVLQCKQQTNMCQKINLGNMVNILDLNVIPYDIKKESEDYESRNYLQENACMFCNETHPETDYVCPIKKEFTEEYTSLHVACRNATEPKTQASPLSELPITNTNVSILQDQVQQSNKDTLQKTPGAFEAHVKVKSLNVQATKTQHIAPKDTGLGNIVSGASITSSRSSEVHHKKRPCQIFDSNSKSINNVEHQKHHKDLIIEKSYKPQSSDKEYQRENAMHNSISSSTNEEPQNTLSHNVFHNINSQSNDKGCQRTLNQKVFDIKDLQSYDKEYKENFVKDISDKSLKNQKFSAKNDYDLKNSQITIVNSSNSIAFKSKSESNDEDHEKKSHNIFDSKSQSHNKENEKLPLHNKIYKTKSLNEEEQQILPVHNVLDKSKSQGNNGKHQKLCIYNIFDKSDHKSKVTESNSNETIQSVIKEISLYSQDKSKYTERDNLKSSNKAKIQITLKESDRPPMYHILDNNGRAQSTFSKEKAKKMLDHSLSVEYSNKLGNLLKCIMYVSTIRNGKTLIPWLHIEFIKADGNKVEKHIPFSKISKIVLWKIDGIRIFYTKSKNELVKYYSICLEVTQHENNIKETVCPFYLTMLKWLRTFCV